MKRNRKKIFPILAVIIVIAVILTVWYFLPEKFLRNVSPTDVVSISVFDGNTGKNLPAGDVYEKSYDERKKH